MVMMMMLLFQFKADGGDDYDEFYSDFINTQNFEVLNISSTKIVGRSLIELIKYKSAVTLFCG